MMLLRRTRVVQMLLILLLLCLLVGGVFAQCALTPMPASAQGCSFGDDFESESIGNLDTQNSWIPVGNAPAQVVETVSHSGTQSIEENPLYIDTAIQSGAIHSFDNGVSGNVSLWFWGNEGVLTDGQCHISISKLYGDNWLGISLLGDGSISYWDGNYSRVTEYVANWNFGEWNHLVMQFTSDGYYSVLLNDTLIISNITYDFESSDGMDAVSIINEADSSEGMTDLFFDDVCVASEGLMPTPMPTPTPTPEITPTPTSTPAGNITLISNSQFLVIIFLVLALVLNILSTKSPFFNFLACFAWIGLITVSDQVWMQMIGIFAAILSMALFFIGTNKSR